MSTDWINLVKTVQREQGVSYKDAMRIASQRYVKKPPPLDTRPANRRSADPPTELGQTKRTSHNPPQSYIAVYGRRGDLEWRHVSRVNADVAIKGLREYLQERGKRGTKKQIADIMVRQKMGDDYGARDAHITAKRTYILGADGEPLKRTDGKPMIKSRGVTKSLNQYVMNPQKYDLKGYDTRGGTLGNKPRIKKLNKERMAPVRAARALAAARQRPLPVPGANPAVQRAMRKGGKAKVKRAVSRKMQPGPLTMGAAKRARK